MPNYYQMKFFSKGPLMLAVLFFIAPVVEEFIFRSWTIFLRKKNKKHNFTSWAIFSSILFALAHIDFYNLNIVYLGTFLSTFGLGLVFAYLAFHHKFIYAIFAHSLYNILVFLIFVMLPILVLSERYGNCMVEKIPFWKPTELYVSENNKIIFAGYPDEVLRFTEKKEPNGINEYFLPNWYKVRIKCENIPDSNKVLTKVKNTLVSFLHIKTDTINSIVYEIEEIPNISSKGTFLMKGEDFTKMISEKTNTAFTMSHKEKTKTFNIPRDFIFIRKTKDVIMLMDKYRIKYKEKHVKGERYFTNY